MRIDRENPCKPGSAAFKIVGVLLSSRKRALLATEIAFRAKINTRKVVQVVSALLNPYHQCLRREGRLGGQARRRRRVLRRSVSPEAEGASPLRRSR